MKVLRTLQLRIKDKHARALSLMARDVNTVWNYCNEISHKAIREHYQFLSGFDLQKLTKGFSKCEGVSVGSTTVQQVCEEYETRRRQFKKSKLSWRVSNEKSSKHSLGWIPFKSGALKYRSGQVFFGGQLFGLWDSYGLSDYELRSGCFSEDSRGRWYLNVQVYKNVESSEGRSIVGVDLGLRRTATCSDGSSLQNGVYRLYEDRLAVAQRARNKDRVRAIHAKIKNIRKDAMHKFSTELVQRSGAVIVGNVKSSAMIKNKRSRMAKSALDAGWAMLKTMLEYKCRGAGVVFEVVNEAYTTQTCSSCRLIPDSSPKGRSGLGIRRWTCSNCGSEHDRDINAAQNIAALGHERLVAGIPGL